MAYVERAPDGTIKGVYRIIQRGYAEEEVADDDPAVSAFLARQSPTPRDLATEVDAIKTELRRTRAAEAVLIEKAIVTKTEIDDKAAEVGEISADAKK